MRTAPITTNATCNQNCSFCSSRADREDRAFVQPAAVRARMGEAVKQGATELLITGGEPTLRRDLPALVSEIVTLGATAILDTNAALVTDAMAAALHEAGLRTARVHLPGWGDECDRITRDPGGFSATLEGMRALHRAGIEVVAHVPILRPNLDLARALPKQIRAAGVAVEQMLVVVPVIGPDPSSLAPLLSAVREIEALEIACRQVGISLRLDPATHVPPCLFRSPDRVAHLFSLSRGGRDRPDCTRVEACGGCIAQDRCPGVPRASLARDAITVRPLVDDRTRRRLTMIQSQEEQIARELRTIEHWRLASGDLTEAHTIRVNFHCNQSCEFCFVSTHLPSPKRDDVERMIREAGEARAVLVLSGGEPTLNPKLLEYVALGRASGVVHIELQTNAIRFADTSLGRELVAAGLDTAFVSLHGSTAEISDAITDAPGTFDRTVLGVDRLHEAGVELRLNHVVCTRNAGDFPSFVAMVSHRWPRASISLSFVGSHTDVVPRTHALIPRYSDVLPAIGEGLRLAERLGVVITGFESMCGIPLCLAPIDARSFLTSAEIPEGEDQGEFIKPPACSTCSLDSRCFGLRRGYAELHGMDEIAPVS